jgi:hypothetical protein
VAKITELRSDDIYERYVLTQLDGLNLFVPQDEVSSVEIISDIHPLRSPLGAIGWFGHGQENPIFCLSDKLQLLTDLPESREYFILLKDSAYPVGITCDEVEPIYLQQVQIEIQHLPPVMIVEDMPIHQLAHYQDRVGVVCHGSALVRYLRLLSDRWQESQQQMDSSAANV